LVKKVLEYIMEKKIREIILNYIPQAKLMNIDVLFSKNGESRLLLPHDSQWTREGGSLSGPSLFALADAALYASILSLKIDQIGALTTQMSIQFLRRPIDLDLVGCSKIHKISKRNAFGEVQIRSLKDDGLIAVATGSYSLKPS